MTEQEKIDNLIDYLLGFELVTQEEIKLWMI